MKDNSFTYNLMLTIDQISQITGIRKSTLRYWEKSFDDFLKPARTHSNRREYTIEDLDRIKAIQRLLDQEHLTALGVRMRLQEILSSHGKKDRGSKAKGKAIHKSPLPSAAVQDSSIQ
jgi:DNA-binding transcriptional MerR regulator